MSRTLSLVCDGCRKSLWVGQESRARGWFVYGTEPERIALNRFVNDHFGHAIRFADSESLWFEIDEVEYSPGDDA